MEFKNKGIGLVVTEIKNSMYLLKGLGLFCKECEKRVSDKLIEIEKNLGIKEVELKIKKEKEKEEVK